MKYESNNPSLLVATLTGRNFASYSEIGSRKLKLSLLLLFCSPVFLTAQWFRVTDAMLPANTYPDPGGAINWNFLDNINATTGTAKTRTDLVDQTYGNSMGFGLISQNHVTLPILNTDDMHVRTESTRNAFHTFGTGETDGTAGNAYRAGAIYYQFNLADLRTKLQAQGATASRLEARFNIRLSDVQGNMHFLSTGEAKEFNTSYESGGTWAAAKDASVGDTVTSAGTNYRVETSPGSGFTAGTHNLTFDLMAYINNAAIDAVTFILISNAYGRGDVVDILQDSGIYMTVPEPAFYGLLTGGVILFSLVRRRSQK